MPRVPVIVVRVRQAVGVAQPVAEKLVSAAVLSEEMPVASRVWRVAAKAPVAMPLLSEEMLATSRV